jgi:hypothetical protein
MRPVKMADQHLMHIAGADYSLDPDASQFRSGEVARSPR